MPTARCSGLMSASSAAILHAWARNRERRFTARRSGHRRNAPQRHARKPTGSPARRGTRACSAFGDRRSHRRHWATRSTPVTAIWKCGASAATRNRPLRSISCGDRRQRQSTNSNATCAARTARRRAAVRTSEATLWRYAARKSPRATHRRAGGQVNGSGHVEVKTVVVSTKE